MENSIFGIIDLIVVGTVGILLFLRTWYQTHD